jgi:MFS family permease
VGRPASEWNGRITSSLAKHRNYRLFFLGQLVSLTGTWMQDVALPWLVYHETKSPFAVGLLVFFRFVPFLVLGLFAGVLADRVDNRRLLIVTQSISSLLALVLAALAFTDSPPVAAIYVVAILGGAAVVIEGPSRQALVYQLVGRDELPNAIALNASLFNAARAVGPALGGVLIAVVGVGWCFAFNALSFLAVLTMLLLMRTSELFPLARDRDPQPTFLAIREGLSHVWRSPLMRTIVICTATMSLAGFNFRVLVPSLAADVFNASPLVFGALYASFGIGATLGALLVAGRGRASWKAFSLGAAGLSLSALGIAAIPGIPAAVLLLFTAGVSFTSWVANGQSLLQLAAPDQLRGRVVSIYIFVFAGFMPVSAVVEGWVADALGTRFAFAFAAVAGLLAAGYAFRRLRTIYSGGRSGPLPGSKTVQVQA